MRRKARSHRSSHEDSCLYQCELCGVQEEIPKDVLEYFDAIDPGLPGQPATFQCQSCQGIMYPLWWFEAEQEQTVGDEETKPLRQSFMHPPT